MASNQGSPSAARDESNSQYLEIPNTAISDTQENNLHSPEPSLENYSQWPSFSPASTMNAFGHYSWQNSPGLATGFSPIGERRRPPEPWAPVEALTYNWDTPKGTVGPLAPSAPQLAVYPETMDQSSLTGSNGHHDSSFPTGAMSASALGLTTDYAVDTTGSFSAIHSNIGDDAQSMCDPMGLQESPLDATKNGQMIRCTYEGCNDQTERTQANHKKHMQKHEKPFKCKEDGCSRGFAMKSDLERHYKSVHKIVLPKANARFWICQGTNCPKPEKLWTRVDNFRSHCESYHEDENRADLIKRSEKTFPESHHTVNLSGSSNDYAQDQMAGILTNSELLSGLSSSMPNFSREHSHLSGPMGYAHTTRSMNEAPNPNGRSSEFSGHDEPRDGPTPVQHSAIAMPPPSNAGDHPRRTRAMGPATRQKPGQAPFLHQKEGNTGISADDEEEKLDALAALVAQDVLVLLQGPTDTTHIQTVDLLKSGLKTSLKNSLEHFSLCTAPKPETRAVTERKKLFKCDECDTKLGRKSELKKHKLRHEKPWACTFACGHKSGSKNDWKRHEGGRHYQPRTFRCDQRVPHKSLGVCATSFVTKGAFQDHLRDDHGVNDKIEISQRSVTCHIGQAWQESFWCGFCLRIIRLTKKGIDAHDERFDHIDYEHFKKGDRVDDWVPYDKQLSIRQQREKDQQNSDVVIADDDDDEVSHSDDSEHDSDDAIMTSALGVTKRTDAYRNGNPTVSYSSNGRDEDVSMESPAPHRPSSSSVPTTPSPRRCRKPSSSHGGSRSGGIQKRSSRGGSQAGDPQHQQSLRQLKRAAAMQKQQQELRPLQTNVYISPQQQQQQQPQPSGLRSPCFSSQRSDSTQNSRLSAQRSPVGSNRLFPEMPPPAPPQPRHTGSGSVSSNGNRREQMGKDLGSGVGRSPSCCNCKQASFNSMDECCPNCLHKACRFCV